MRKITLIIGMCILLLLVTGAGYKFYLSQYEEECYQYAIENYVYNYSYEDYEDGAYCIGDTSGYWGLNCSIVTKYWYFNSTRFTDKCVKYHLVRYG